MKIFIVMLLLASVGTSGVPVAAATTYYVSQSDGDDSWNGQVESHQGTAGPWKTLARASTNYVTGDRIKLKCGDTWNEELHPQGSGTASAPITIGSYGDGPKPVIDRQDDKQDRIGIHLSDQEGYRIVGIEFVRCMTGIYAEYSDGVPTRKYLWIEDCYFHDSRMYQKYEDYPAHKIGLGICLFSYERHNRIVSSGITVKNCVFRRLASALWTNSPDNFNGDAINIWTFGNLTVENCLFEEGDQWQLGLRMVDGGVVRNCITHDIGRNFQSLNGVAGAMFQRCRNFLLENSEWGFVSIGEKGKTSGDGEAFDFETSCSNILVRGCSFHDTDGPGFLIISYGPRDRNGAIWFEHCVFNGKVARPDEVDAPRVEIWSGPDDQVEFKDCRFYLRSPTVKLTETKGGIIFTRCLVKTLDDACSTPNLALQASVSASSQMPGHGAELAMDGNTNTFWQAATTNELWLQLNFAVPMMVNEFLLREEASSSILRYAIECWDETAFRWVVCFKGRQMGREFMAPIVSRMTRKVRLRIEKTTGGLPAMVEIGVYNDTTRGPHEAIIKAVASAASEDPGHAAALAVDGDDSTYWRAASTNESWLQLDFDVPATINECRIREGSISSLGGFRIEYWDERISGWTLCYKGVIIGIERFVSFDRLNTRKLRLTITKMRGGKPAIDAFEAYNDTRRGQGAQL